MRLNVSVAMWKLCRRPWTAEALLPLSSSAACCTPHRDAVAKLYWKRHSASECRHRCSRAADSGKRQQGCAQSRDAARHSVRIIRV
ncbi:hypothetical protein DES53_11519 [Roseimicrobium gellanilyticum]|uniref:Uncharacterized protein n=1 Tax=Roseimicrobium gellanilyticum TaxID=748857 RepID=A0A366H4P1_9BACT|nr:hypothetical protein DES53_11519 [Roseimicrobium gellanilyticum]